MPATSPQIAPERRRFARLSEAAWTRVILVLAFLAFLPTINYDFVWDDQGLILVNPWMADWSDAAKLVTHHMWASAGGFTYHPANYYRPVFMLWLLALQKLSGGLPGIFHFANVLLHGVATALVIMIARRLLRNAAAALIAGSLFALHPIHVEAVAWISSATELLCAVGVLGSVATFLRWQDSEWQAKKWLAASLALFAVGLFSKESAIVLPMALACYLVALRLRAMALVRIAAPYFGVVALYIGIRLRVLGHMAESHNSPGEGTLVALPWRVLWYAKQLLWPVHLSVSYPSLREHGAWSSGLLLGLLTLAFFVVVWKCRRSAACVLMGALSLGALAPVLLQTFVPLQDRYLYLPSLGVCVLAGWLLVNLPTPGRSIAVSVLLIAGFAGIVKGERIWQNDETLFVRAVEVNPIPDNLVRLGAVYTAKGQPELELALLESGLEQNPNTPVLLQELGMFYFNQKQFDRARDYFLQAQQHATSRRSWAADACMLGTIDFESGDLVAAEPKLRAGLDANSTNNACRGTLVNVLTQLGRTEEAQAERAKMP